MIKEYIRRAGRYIEENPITRYTLISGVIPFGGFIYSVLNFNPETLLPLTLSESGIIIWTAACVYFAPLLDRNRRTLRDMENNQVERRGNAEEITRGIEAHTKRTMGYIDRTIRAIREDGEETRRQIRADGEKIRRQRETPETGIDGLLDNT